MAFDHRQTTANSIALTHYSINTEAIAKVVRTSEFLSFPLAYEVVAVGKSKLLILIIGANSFDQSYARAQRQWHKGAEKDTIANCYRNYQQQKPRKQCGGGAQAPARLEHQWQCSADKKREQQRVRPEPARDADRDPCCKNHDKPRTFVRADQQVDGQEQRRRGQRIRQEGDRVISELGRERSQKS